MSQQEDNISAKIDDIDLRIIKILNEDGRTPFSQIAKQLGVSTGMIRQRYHRLIHCLTGIEPDHPPFFGCFGRELKMRSLGP